MTMTVSATPSFVIPNQNKGKGNHKKEWTPRKKVNTEIDILDKLFHVHITKDEEGILIYPKHTTW